MSLSFTVANRLHSGRQVVRDLVFTCVPGPEGDPVNCTERCGDGEVNILGVSPSVAAVPHDDSAVFGNSSSPPSLSAILRAEMVSLKWSLQARVAHSRHRVLPVPVGLSRTPFTF